MTPGVATNSIAQHATKERQQLRQCQCSMPWWLMHVTKNINACIQQLVPVLHIKNAAACSDRNAAWQDSAGKLVPRKTLFPLLLP
jgi:hypothetical protein